MAERTDAERLEGLLSLLGITREQYDHVQDCDDGCTIELGDDYGTAPGFSPGCGPQRHLLYPDRYDEAGKWIGPHGPNRTIGTVLESAYAGEVVQVLLSAHAFPKVPVKRKPLSFGFEKTSEEG